MGGHGELSCRTCHAEESDHALEKPGQKPRTCLDCHDSPHAAEFARESCLVCHAAVHTSFRDERLTVTPAQHARTGFLLDAPHDQPVCADCHQPEGATFLDRYPGRKAESCRACHLDVHEGQFEENCTSCHAKTHFTPHLFDEAAHAKTAFPLEGSHGTQECNACHLDPVAPASRAFAGTESACAACHTDAHGGFFGTKSCDACHTTAHFADRPEGKFDHGRDARFALKGAHAQSRCEECHKPAETRDAHGRTFGRIEGYFGCATCHIDPHVGEWDQPPHPPASAENADARGAISRHPSAASPRRSITASGRASPRRRPRRGRLRRLPRAFAASHGGGTHMGQGEREHLRGVPFGSARGPIPP
ncbi:MAG: hypothetical protein HC813_02575 [Planctomycetes bacterium]|nr:hypothetical protein [Planctomycetota bacterium]